MKYQNASVQNIEGNHANPQNHYHSTFSQHGYQRAGSNHFDGIYTFNSLEKHQFAPKSQLIELLQSVVATNALAVVVPIACRCARGYPNTCCFTMYSHSRSLKLARNLSINELKSSISFIEQYEHNTLIYCS